MKPRSGVFSSGLVLGTVLMFCGGRALATTVQLNVAIDSTNQAWTVTALVGDNQQLGLASWTIDVIGTGGVSVMKAAVASQTNQSPNAFSVFRSTGIISGSNLLDIQASQDTVDAIDNYDDSGQAGSTALVYGYGFNGTANGQYTSNNYGVPGPVVGQGSITLATGRYTGSVYLDGPGNIIATLSSGGYFNFFPLNWDPDSQPRHGATGTFSVTAVYASPEPGSIVLLGLGGVGMIVVLRRRTV